MNNNLLKHISEYFNTFPKEDYTFYVNGIPTERCSFNNDNRCVIYKLPDNSSVPGGIIYDKEWYAIYDWEIAELSITATGMTIKKINGGERTFTAKIKRKEEKAKEIIFNAKMALYTHIYDDVLKYLDELKVLMNE